MNPVAKEFLNRLKDSVERTSALGRVSFWLEKNTTLHGRPFSFKGHEYQREIIDDTHPNSVVIKPSQVGLSECAARLMVGFLAISPDVVGIYTLPTVYEALRFSKSRIDPIIRTSKYLSSIVVGGNDSASFKQLGSSQVFMAGTFGKALISIPTDILFNDEVDFSNPEVLVTAESRLSHSRIHNEELDMRGIRRKFSTPTVPNVGVSALYDQSDQRRRLVRCRHCTHWFWPSFLDHVVVDGYSGSLHEITYIEVQDLDARGLVDTARLLCPACHHTLGKGDLQPQYREWVAERPSVKHQRGWAVSPFDLPDYHSPASLLRKKLEFKEEEGHYRNFTLGLAHADASNSVIPGVVAANSILQPLYPDSMAPPGEMLAALDVGKTSWLAIGRNVGDELHVVWTEQIRIGIGAEDQLYDTVIARLIQFNVVKFICDAMPYTDTILRIQRRMAPGMVMPCLYNLTDRRSAIYQVRDSDMTVEANRTKALDTIVKRLNTGKVKFAKLPDSSIMESHFQGMKRVDRIDNEGEKTAVWVKTSPDHYLHVMNYLNIASMMTGSDAAIVWAPPVQITEAFVGRKYELTHPQKAADPLNLFRRDE